uniref:Cytochrome n=2 Tax=Lutzomyia longipalpis TaxID=7200 RepID=A0A1B0CD20_LUTLO
MVLVEVIAGLFVAIWLLAQWWQRSAKNYWKKIGIPYIPGRPFIGSGFVFKQSMGEFFMDLYNDPGTKNEPIAGFYFFHKPSLLIRDPELIKRILVTDFNVFMDRIFSSDPISDTVGVNLLPMVKGEKWKKVRFGISPVFTGNKLKNFFLIVKQTCDEFDVKLAADTAKGTAEYDVKHLSGLLTVDMIAQCFFGVKANSLTNPKSEFYENANAMTEFTLRQTFAFFCGGFFPEYAQTLKITLFPRSVNKFLQETINYVMSNREASGVKCNDLIDILITMKKTQKEIFDGDVLVGQAATFLAAGYETTSSAISFALYSLAKHPEVQEKLRKEILEEIEKSGGVTYEGIHNLEYTNMVIQETLRMYPSLTVLDRIYMPQDNEPYSLEPHHPSSIPKGISVYIPTFGIHRDPNFYPNPETFNPERFRDISNDPQSKYMFLSFGLGPRQCLGARFGMIQMKMALISILRNYRVE